MGDMEPTQKWMRAQFRLRSLLLAIMWFALILAVCIQDQHAATRHRKRIDSLKAAGLLSPGAAPVRLQPSAQRPPAGGERNRDGS